MLFADAIPAGADYWVQYGCFGLLAGLVVWAVRWGIPKALEIHKETVAKLTDTYTAETEKCREERMQAAAGAAEEREKDREARHNLADKLQELIAAIQSKG